jgi:hypothetical protein
VPQQDQLFTVQITESTSQHAVSRVIRSADRRNLASRVIHTRA